MKTTSWKRRILLVLVGVVIGALLVGTSIAVTANSFRYSEAKTGYLAIANQDFIPQDDEASFNHSSTSGTNSEQGCFSAPIHLPQGSRAKSVTYVYKSPAGEDMDFYGEFGRRSGHETGDSIEYDDMSNRAEPVDDSNIKTAITRFVFDDVERINNRRFMYSLLVCPFGGAFYGARVKYTYRTAGD